MGSDKARAETFDEGKKQRPLLYQVARGANLQGGFACS